MIAVKSGPSAVAEVAVVAVGSYWQRGGKLFEVIVCEGVVTLLVDAATAVEDEASQPIVRVSVADLRRDYKPVVPEVADAA